VLSLVTIVKDRPLHLARLLRAVAAAEPPPDEIVVVDMGSQVTAREAEPPGCSRQPVWTSIAAEPGHLPLATARNRGAATATGDQLVFLDVDCIPSAHTFGAYRDAIGRGGLVCGPVRYLERFWEVGLPADPDERVLRARSSPHPVRPPPDAERVGEDHELFWSLSFGCCRRTWEAIGGFDEAFVGYGAEDTDFAFTARARGIPVRWIPGGEVFHQWHRSEAPPVEHLASIVANAATFREKWDRWPMQGWLAEFARRGLVDWDPAGTRLERPDRSHVARPRPRRVLSVPASHPYTRKVAPPEIDVVADPTQPWWPHRAFDLDWLLPRLDDVDVVHVHFGFDHLDPDHLVRWTGALAAAGVPLVLTVHDLLSPHEPDPARHLGRLRPLLDAAAAVLTLTDPAAQELAGMGHPGAVVVPHPHVAPLEPPPPRRRSRPARIGLHLKSGRANLLPPGSLVGPLAKAAADAGADLDLRLDRHAPEPMRAEVGASADELGVPVVVGPRLDDADVLAYVDGLDVSVLPYAFGTHSGWLELCRDRGVRVVAPDVGHYRAQWDDVEPFEVRDGRADPTSLTAAVGRALRRPLPDPATIHRQRTEQLAWIHEAHRRVYAEVLGGGPP
jgi:GT2 family glycosyltransferase